MSTVTMVRGEEFFIGWRWRTDSTTYKDLTGYTILIQIRPFDTSSTIIASFATSSPYITFTPLSGLVELNLPPSVTMAYTFKNAVIDCLVTDAANLDGDRSPLSSIKLNWGVSRT